MARQEEQSACPKVSVLIPVHNGEKTLGQCLESVLDQDYENYEVIVVDNNSTDRTAEIVRGLSADNLKMVFEKFVSRGAARNRGIMNARGEIIAMTDSDCIVPSNWLSELTRPILEENEVAVQGNESDVTGNYWTRMQQRFNQRFLSMSSGGKYTDNLDTKNFAVKRDVLNDAGLFNENMKNMEDFELKIRLKQKGVRIFLLSDTKVRHFHKSSLSSLFASRVDRGYWVFMAREMHKDSGEVDSEENLKALRPLNFLSFFPWVIAVLFRQGFSDFVFELVTGTAWRAGILLGMVRKVNFSRSLKQSSERGVKWRSGPYA